jgi:hypothetical protein
LPERIPAAHGFSEGKQVTPDNRDTADITDQRKKKTKVSRRKKSTLLGLFGQAAV